MLVYCGCPKISDFLWQKVGFSQKFQVSSFKHVIKSVVNESFDPCILIWNLISWRHMLSVHNKSQIVNGEKIKFKYAVVMPLIIPKYSKDFGSILVQSVSSSFLKSIGLNWKIYRLTSISIECKTFMHTGLSNLILVCQSVAIWASFRLQDFFLSPLTR